MNTTQKRSPIFLFFLLFIPILVFAQDDVKNAEQIVLANHHFTEIIAQLFPISLSPYLTLFVTCLFTKINLSTSFMDTHPFFNSWFVMLLSLTFFLITLIPKFFSKLAAPITLTANFLDNKASIIIVLIITILPDLMASETAETTAVLIKAGFLGDILLPFRVFIIAAVSVIYIVVVMTVRLFLEILIMLSPVPLIDTIFEVAKIVFTIGFIILGIISPNTAFAISIITFLISLVLYRKATRTITKIKFLIINPVLYFILRKKGHLLSDRLPYAIKQKFDEISLAIPVFNLRTLGDIRKNQSIWLVKSKDQLILARTAFLQGVKTHQIPAHTTLKLNNNLMNLRLASSDDQLRLLISKSYLAKKEELETLLGCETPPEVVTAEKSDEHKVSKGLKRFFGFFDVKTLIANKKMLLGKEQA